MTRRLRRRLTGVSRILREKLGIAWGDLAAAMPSAYLPRGARNAAMARGEAPWLEALEGRVLMSAGGVVLKLRGPIPDSVLRAAAQPTAAWQAAGASFAQPIALDESATCFDIDGQHIGLPKEPPGSGGSGGGLHLSALSLAEALSLHSRPTSNFTIFLDFDGHVSEGTLWNSDLGLTTLVSPPYSLDANFAAFSSTELDRIERVWRRVADDFAAFDVNVTTQDPGVEALRNTGGGDTKWGQRVVITDDDLPAPGSGGVAWIGVFDSNEDVVAFVFNSSEDGIVEAATHEVGHTLGLSHDGLISPATTYYNGHGIAPTSWGPLLGAPYGRSVTQWDNGTYYQANNGTASSNYNSGPDDLLVITTQNGFGYAADDHGNTRPAATALKGASAVSLSAFGNIEQRTDVDYFSFQTGTGNVSFTLNPLLAKGNLDIWAGIYDGAQRRGARPA